MSISSDTQKNTICYLCGSPRQETVPGKVRDKPDLAIKRCQECGLVFLDSFDHIAEDYYIEDYNDQTHHNESWQHFLNRSRADDQRRTAELKTIVLNKSFLDVGCGAGGLLLSLKDRCRRVVGVESQQPWRQGLAQAGIETHESLEKLEGSTFDVISLLMVLEHVKDPIPLLHRIAGMLAPNGQMIIETPNSEDALLSLYRSKAFSEFTYWSPHLFLYNRQTLAALLKKAGLRINHIRHVQRYPLSNHMRWLACGTPGGHIDWSFLDSPELTLAYSQQLAILGLSDTILASASAQE